MTDREQELESIVEELRDKLRLAETTSGGSSTSQRVIVNNTWEKKVNKYKLGDDIDDWISTVKPYVQKKLGTEPERISYILDHLEKIPKQEVRFRIDEDKATSSEILDILIETYGIKESVLDVQREFFDCKQKPEETIDNYSHRLMEHALTLRKLDSHFARTMEKTMKAQFADWVQNPLLKLELKRLNNEQEAKKFHQLRDHANWWLRNGQEISLIQKPTKEECTAMEVLAQKVEVQQEEIQSLKDKMQRNNNQGSTQSQSRGRDRGRPNHFNQSYQGYNSRGNRGNYSQGYNNHRYRNNYWENNYEGTRPNQSQVHRGSRPYQGQQYRGYRPYQGQQSYRGQGYQQHRTDNSNDTPSEPFTFYCHRCKGPNHIARDCWMQTQTQDQVNSHSSETSQNPLNDNHSSRRGRP